MDDNELLRSFVEKRDEQAFARIVQRYLDVVYAAALRQLRGNTHLADDVSQAVFILLTKKAHSIRGGSVLAGWLVNAARLCAQAAARNEARRKTWETKAAAMRSEPGYQHEQQVHVHAIVPILDEALARLTDSDRTAVTLRFLQGKPLKEVAATMGVSEAAATKRVSRATVRLREFFARRGVELTPAALSDVLVRHGHVFAPPHLADAAISATSTTRALELATQVSSQLAWKSLAVAAIVSTVAGLVVISAAVAVVLGKAAQAQQTASPAAATRPATAPSGKIRIGYYLSDASATSNGLDGKLVGYSMVLFDQMKDPAFDIVPVIERGTESNGELPQVLNTYFRGTKPLVASDAAALKTLDVLVVGTLITPDDVIDAIEEAVKSGLGLMTRNWFAIQQPGYTPQVLRLYGLEEARYDFETNALECEVLAPDHPILGSRKATPGTRVLMRANGTFGILSPQSKGLIKVKDAGKVAYMHRTVPENYTYYTVYTSELGKGRIVCCCYATYDTQRHLSESVGPQFLKRSLKWLAQRPVE